MGAGTGQGPQERSERMRIADQFVHKVNSLKSNARIMPGTLHWAWRYVERDEHPSLDFINFMIRVLTRVNVLD